MTLPVDDFLSSISEREVRRLVVDACERLRIAEDVLQVKQFRDDIKDVRVRTAEGEVVIVADRGTVNDPRHTMVVLSLQTLQEAIAQTVQETRAARKRRRLADMLVGLPPVPAAARDFEIDFEQPRPVSGGPAGSDIEL